MDKKKVAVPLVCHGHSRPVVDLFYSPITPDGFFLISASKDSSPMLRNGETGDWIGTFEGHKGAVWSCCLDTNALRAASGSADFTALLWWFCFKSSDLIVLRDPGANVITGRPFRAVVRRSDMIPIRAIERPRGRPNDADMTALSWLWDVRSGKIVQTLETKSPVTSAEVSQDGRYITTADGSTVKFWDANHFGLVKSYNMPCTVESASLEPKLGNKFIAGGEDMWIRLFDFHTGEEIGCNKGHHGPVHCVRFAPGGESYASGSEDGTIRIWQTGPAAHDEGDALLANGSAGKVKVTADEVAHKIEGFHIPKEEKEEKSEEKEEATDA
ncbi:serine-threonine kinase receptor-associated protein-like [Macadamia integrifolia]|uniref:serine-threonine kinase receptor-associated protein-like n=1 Tax=Macadamia integrifolia TaxID=60698 RepID=UPI001C4F96C2|nr:serine-threonine kinase receptor-associated protein-like [Macadamia integrifolia]